MLKKNRGDKPVFHSMSNERNVRARRAEDNVRNVRAETLIVGESSEPKIEGQHKRSIIMPNDEEMTLCLNKSMTTGLILVLAVLSAFCAATSFYILFDMCSTRFLKIKF